MEREDLTRYAWGHLRIPAEVEHEDGVSLVSATFHHEEWPSASVEYRATVRAKGFGRYPQRASVILSSRQRPTYPGPYRLKQLRVYTRRGRWHDVSPLRPLDFCLEEDPSLPAHERNVHRFVRGEEVSLKVEASSPDGVKAVAIMASGGYGWGSYGEPLNESIRLQGEGDGGEKCGVLLKGRIGDSQRLGRYRAHEMKIVSPKPSRFAGDRVRGERLNPPLVFEVLKNPNPSPPPPKKPEVPNWGF